MTPTVCDSPEALADRVAVDFAALVAETLRNAPRFTLALSGGTTPKQFYTRLAQAPYQTQIPWDKIWMFWGDERCVPPEHSESNFGMARNSLLEKVPVPNAHVFRIRGEDPPHEAARAYETTLKNIFGETAPWPAFDLVLLGLGPDGHTASLIPGTSAVSETHRWVVENVVRSLQTVRVTMTLLVINHARQVWFLATGTKKREIFAKAQAGPNPDCPASLVQPDPGGLRWYVDKAVVGDPSAEFSPVKANRFWTSS